jgi:hypothetical protein
MMAAHKKRRLRQVHLPGDKLHDIIVEPRRIEDDARRVAGERPLGEGVVTQDLNVLPGHWSRWPVVGCRWSVTVTYN